MIMTTTPVTVHAMTLGLAPNEEPTEWYAACMSHNWYGDYRQDERDAKADAARHRRSHSA